jgi:hypothetical protein
MIGNKLLQKYLSTVGLAKCPNVIATYLTLQQHFLDAGLDIAKFSNLFTFNVTNKKLTRFTYISSPTLNSLSVSANASGGSLTVSDDTQPEVTSEYIEDSKPFECLIIAVPSIPPLNQNLLYCLAPNLDMVFEITENNDFRCVCDANFMKEYGLKRIQDIQKCIANSIKAELDDTSSDLINIIKQDETSLIGHFVDLGVAYHKQYKKYFNKAYPFSNSLNFSKKLIEHYFQFIFGAAEYIDSLTYAGDKLILDYLNFTDKHFYYSFQERMISLDRVLSWAENYKFPKNKEDYANKIFALECDLNNALVDYDNIFGDTFFSDLKLSSRLPRSLDLLRYKVAEKTYAPVFFRIESSDIIFNHEIRVYAGSTISKHLVERKLVLVKNEHQFCIDFNNRVNDEQSSSNNLCISDELAKYNLVPNFETIKNSLFRSDGTFLTVIGAKQADKVAQLYFEYGLPDFFNNIDKHFKQINPAINNIGTREEFLNNMSQLYDGLANVYNKAQEFKDEIAFIGHKALDEIKREPDVI